MNLKVFIGDVEYDFLSGFSIQQQASSISSSSIDVKVMEGDIVPQSFQPLQIFDDTTPIFLGIIQSVSSPSFKANYYRKNYRLEVLSYECVFNNRLISDAFENQTTDVIVQSIFDQYITEENIDIGEILSAASSKTYEYYNYNNTKMYDILRELAEEINATFYVSGDKKFYFCSQETFPIVDVPTDIRELQKEDDQGELRSVQIVTGASEETSLQTENVIWATDQVNFSVAYQVSDITGITINAVPAGIGVLGVDEDDATKTFLWQVGSNTISLNSNATIKPSATDNVVILYYGFFDIIITNTNDQLISQLSELNGSSGKIENVYTDETIDNFTDANEKANDLLDQHSDREIEISAYTNSLEKSNLFNVWQLDFPEIDIVGDFVIIERNITDFGDEILARVKLKSKNFYKKYGTVFKEESKQVRKDIKVFKETSIGDTATATENYSFLKDDIVNWPVGSVGGDISDPGLPGFYPV